MRTTHSSGDSPINNHGGLHNHISKVCYSGGAPSSASELQSAVMCAWYLTLFGHG